MSNFGTQGAEVRFYPLKVPVFGTICQLRHPDFRVKNRTSAPGALFSFAAIRPRHPGSWDRRPQSDNSLLLGVISAS
jgi:hypothetical protein